MKKSRHDCTFTILPQEDGAILLIELPGIPLVSGTQSLHHIYLLYIIFPSALLLRMVVTIVQAEGKFTHLYFNSAVFRYIICSFVVFRMGGRVIPSILVCVFETHTFVVSPQYIRHPIHSTSSTSSALSVDPPCVERLRVPYQLRESCRFRVRLSSLLCWSRLLL